MGDLPAHDRLPARAPCDRARRDPAGAAAPLRREPPQAAPVPGAQGGVLPARLRARSRHPRAGRSRSAPHRRRPAHAADGRALPPGPQPRLRRSARSPGKRPRRARRGPAATARAGRRAAAAGAAIRDRARARGRRPEPGLGLRPRDLGRGQHESRGGRTRRPGLHDLPGPHGRRRREADARGQAPPAGARERRRDTASRPQRRAPAPRSATDRGSHPRGDFNSRAGRATARRRS